ncbi:NUDIX hydrolase [Cellulomonas hominis]
MAIPDFVVDLRAKIGHDALWLPGVTAVVVRPTIGSLHGVGGADGTVGAVDEVLLVRRADTGAWTPVTGIIDPGEDPAVAGAREVLEEASVVAEPERLAWVSVLPPMTYANGDRAQYLDLTFRFRYVSGETSPGDEENTATGWFRLDALPEISAEMRRRIDRALAPTAECGFDF